MALTPDATPSWTIKFEDGYIGTFGKRQMESMLRNTKSIKVGKQIDYVLVSTAGDPQS